MWQYGGPSPIPDTTITVEVPDGTTVDNPVLPSILYRLKVGSGYKLEACSPDDDPTKVYLCEVLSRVATMGPVGVLVLWPGILVIRVLPYNPAEAPSVGDSIKISSDGKTLTGQAHAVGKGLVMKVDATTATCEVFL